MSNLKPSASLHLEGYLDPETRAKRIKSAVARIRYQVKKGNDFEAIAYRGASGAITASILAHILNKPLILVRKPEDKEGHSQLGVEYSVPNIKSYLIADDFICSGKTYEAIRTAVKQEIPDAVCIGMIDVTSVYKKVSEGFKRSRKHLDELGLYE